MSDRPSAYHTPEDIAGDSIIRMVVSPVSLLPHIGGALGELLESDNWDEVGVTIPEVIEEIIKMIDQFYEPFLIGAIMPFVNQEVPPGWMIMDGQEILSQDYPEFAAVAPELWILDADTIQLPVMADTYLTGIGFGAGVPGDFTGENTRTLGVAQMPSHTHNYIRPLPNIDIEAPGIPDVIAAGVGPLDQTQPRGGGEPFSIRPLSMKVYYAIFLGRKVT